MSSEPPEEPLYRSLEPSLLSPASPKPVHFPTPTNITVLEMQMDVGFNQTEAHMSDASRNTEVRPDFWRDPNEQTEAIDHASPFSTGGDEVEMAAGEANAEVQPAVADDAANSMDTAHNIDEPEPEPVSMPSSAIDEANVTQSVQVAQPTSDPSVPAGDTDQYASETQTTLPSVDSAQSAQLFSGAVDVQSLLDSLQTAPASSAGDGANSAFSARHPEGINLPTANSPFPSQQAHTSVPVPPPGAEGASSPLSASGLGVPPSGLPPRPPPQEQPLIHPNYVHSQHIRDYHPHASHPAFQPHARSGSQGNVADPSSKNYVPPVHSPSSATVPSETPSTAQAPSMSTTGSAYVPNGQQIPTYAPGTGDGAIASYPSQSAGFAASPQTMYAAQYPPANNASTEVSHENTAVFGGQPRPEDRPWNGDIQRKYDQFIEDERKYVSEGRWEQFPQGSRLFVGNLSSEKVTKRDIFHVFHTYGHLAQISIKQAYGFVQFLRTEDCVRALEMEQGTQIRDKKIHLEVSKPQKNRTQNNNQRRSRSPPDSGRGRPGSNVDRYVSGARAGYNRGQRDGYYRSPSPRGYRDRHDDRRRERSQSPDYGRSGRYRSPSPRRDVDDDLPLPRRAPRDVPDVQIIVLDTLDREFISWVEKAFSQRSVRVDVLLLSPRLSEQAVVRRQIMEGVVAVVKLTRQNQNTGKIGLQIFDRRQGAHNVKFEEYDGLDPNVTVELVLRAKQTHAAPGQSPGGYGGAAQYGGQPYVPPMPAMPPAPQYGAYGSQAPPPPTAYGQTPQHQGYPPPFAQPPPPQGQTPGVPPNLQNLITNLDPNNLQNLLSAMNTPQSANSNPYGQPGSAQPSSAMAAQLQNNPALAGYLQQQAAQQGVPGSAAGGAPNMQEILARLGNYQR